MYPASPSLNTARCKHHSQFYKHRRRTCFADLRTTGRRPSDLLRFPDMSATIRQIMNEVAEAIQNIAESSQATTSISSTVVDSVDAASITVNDVSDMSQKQQTIANALETVVKKFQL